MHSIRTLSLVFVFAGCTTAPAFGQGMLPNKPPQNTAANADAPILIGQTVPESMTVLNSGGTPRTLLSYKAATEVMVVGFFSQNCPALQRLMGGLQRFTNDYKGWHVGFVAISVDTAPQALDADFAKAGFKWPIATDPSGTLLKRFHITATPEILVLDESGVLRYRGPFNACYDPAKRPCKQFLRDALDAVIGHVEAVPHAEPSMGGGCPLATSQ